MRRAFNKNGILRWAPKGPPKDDYYPSVMCPIIRESCKDACAFYEEMDNKILCHYAKIEIAELVKGPPK